MIKYFLRLYWCASHNPYPPNLQAKPPLIEGLKKELQMHIQGSAVPIRRPQVATLLQGSNVHP